MFFDFVFVNMLLDWSFLLIVWNMHMNHKVVFSCTCMVLIVSFSATVLGEIYTYLYLGDNSWHCFWTSHKKCINLFIYHPQDWHVKGDVVCSYFIALLHNNMLFLCIEFSCQLLIPRANMFVVFNKFINIYILVFIWYKLEVYMSINWVYIFKKLIIFPHRASDRNYPSRAPFS
jgi:hypothetical protein